MSLLVEATYALTHTLYDVFRNDSYSSCLSLYLFFISFLSNADSIFMSKGKEIILNCDTL